MDCPEEPADFGSLGAPGRHDLLHIAAEGLECACGGGDQVRDLGVDASVAEVWAEGDAKIGDVCIEACQVVDARTRQARVIERMRAGGGVQEQRRIAHRSGEGAHVGDVVVVAHGDVRHDAPCRLQPEHTAEMRRYADRAGTVGALVQRSEATGRGGPRTGGRGAGVETVSPRIVCHTGQGTAADAGPAELRRGGLAEDDGAGRLEALGDRGVRVRDLADLGVRTGLQRMAGELVEVLDRDRYAVQRAEVVAPCHRALGVPRHVQREFRRELGEGIDATVVAFDAVQHGPHDFDRGDVPGADARSEFRRRCEAEVVVPHRAGPGLTRGHARCTFSPAGPRSRDRAGTSDP